MGILLKQYFTGSSKYNGLINRPAWHRKDVSSKEWVTISTDEDEEIRYWFRDKDRSQVHFWSGFSFALSPEYYGNGEIDIDDVENKMLSLLGLNLHVVISVGWRGSFHYPFILRVYSETLRGSKFAEILDGFLRPVMLHGEDL